MNLDQTFKVARKKWGGNGSGSTVEKTSSLVGALGVLITELNIKSVMDFGCGSLGWMLPIANAVERYVGIDVVAEVNQGNREKFPNLAFLTLNDDTELPPCDLVLCRDTLAHLSNQTALAMLKRMKESGSKWLLSTHRPTSSNQNIKDGAFRPVNLCRIPFNFPAPRQTIQEGHEAKELGLWSFEKLSL